jgi:hypothetical protein
LKISRFTHLGHQGLQSLRQPDFLRSFQQRSPTGGATVTLGSVLPLPVGTGLPRPPLSKKSIDFDHEIMENEKSSDSDHEIMNLVEKKCRHSSNPGKGPALDVQHENFGYTKTSV